MKRGKEKRSVKSKFSKAIALSQIFSLVLEIFAISFIFGGMAVLSSGGVSATITQTATVDGATYYISEDGYVYADSEQQTAVGTIYANAPNQIHLTNGEIKTAILNPYNPSAQPATTPAVAVAPANGRNSGEPEAPSPVAPLPANLMPLSGEYNKNINDLTNQKNALASQFQAATGDARGKIGTQINDFQTKIDQQQGYLNNLNQDSAVIDAAMQHAGLTPDEAKIYIQNQATNGLAKLNTLTQRYSTLDINSVLTQYLSAVSVE